MSIQACRISLYGYKFDFYEPIFKDIPIDIEGEYVDVWGIPTGYYDLQYWKNTKPYQNSCLVYISDGMNADYKYIGYLKSATYIENTLGDPFWETTPRFDEWVMKRTKPNIEMILRKELGEPQLFTFDHYQ